MFAIINGRILDAIFSGLVNVAFALPRKMLTLSLAPSGRETLS